MSLDVTINGLGSVESKLLALSRQVPQKAGQALREEAEIEMTEAKQRTPVDTGALRASGRVEGPDVSGAEVSVVLQFGDAAAPYAIYVHENLDALHKVGQAKYLESVIVESKPHLAARIAKRLGDLLGM